jgi:hypothetical protein
LIHRHAELERQRHKRVPFLDLYFFFWFRRHLVRQETREC